MQKSNRRKSSRLQKIKDKQKSLLSQKQDIHKLKSLPTSVGFFYNDDLEANDYFIIAKRLRNYCILKHNEEYHSLEFDENIDNIHSFIHKLLHIIIKYDVEWYEPLVLEYSKEDKSLKLKEVVDHLNITSYVLICDFLLKIESEELAALYSHFIKCFNEICFDHTFLDCYGHMKYDCELESIKEQYDYEKENSEELTFDLHEIDFMESQIKIISMDLSSKIDLLVQKYPLSYFYKNDLSIDNKLKNHVLSFCDIVNSKFIDDLPYIKELDSENPSMNELFACIELEENQLSASYLLSFEERLNNISIVNVCHETILGDDFVYQKNTKEFQDKIDIFFNNIDFITKKINNDYY